MLDGIRKKLYRKNAVFGRRGRDHLQTLYVQGHNESEGRWLNENRIDRCG